ncbi:divalent metal cation transporter [Mucilaginibacter sp.]|jgi:NRAMP (natural resistance-associated macrophage protein)-like metal ion transporter|uniref:NRAMP family divalent metal transporter n=1 Tax=Mucilaginibacter sp. TaxID=1882438 RepID=UPI002CE2C11A|nr:divalent metal cation transporter [Mucilaginibacter sp.]HTI58751.1 divalent metal cation transporter [Mucilaginibacter sp.]
MSAPKGIFKKTISVLKKLGPGLVTGSSDDDPSGIATYSQAGAQFGLSMLWTALVTFPLMASIQEMCARIGLVTSSGLTSTLKNHYPKWILWVMIIFSFPAIVLNIGADIAGMGAAAHLICRPVPAFVFSILFTGLIIVAIIYYPYQKLAAALKWACITLLVYLAVPFFTDTKWLQVLRHTVVPHIELNRDFFGMLVAILGTTISPYLFFWQATMEAEGMKQSKIAIIVDKRILKDMRKDVDIGMLFSNIVMFFIILTCGNVLYPHGVHQIETVEQAAVALRPIAGDLTYTLFAIGIIGTGFLAIPVLSGSLSYMFAETFDWDEGLDKKFFQAKPFYAVIVVALIIGLFINFIGITPLQGLIYSAMLYGITSPVIILIVLHISNNRKIMGDNVNNRWSNITGAITFLLMLGAALSLFI